MTDWHKLMEEYKTDNKKWLELLNELSDIAAFFQIQKKWNLTLMSLEPRSTY